METVPTLSEWLYKKPNVDKKEIKQKRREQIKTALRTKSIKEVAYEFDTYYMAVYRIARSK